MERIRDLICPLDVMPYGIGIPHFHRAAEDEVDSALPQHSDGDVDFAVRTALEWFAPNLSRHQHNPNPWAILPKPLLCIIVCSDE
jgi:hypothetical protein